MPKLHTRAPPEPPQEGLGGGGGVGGGEGEDGDRVGGEGGEGVLCMHSVWMDSGRGGGGTWGQQMEACERCMRTVVGKIVRRGRLFVFNSEIGCDSLRCGVTVMRYVVTSLVEFAV
jgi:hypothetical protein